MHGSYTTTVVKVPHIRPPVFPTPTTSSNFKMGNLKIVVRIILHRSGTWFHHSPVYKTFLQNNISTYIYNKHVLLSPWSSVCDQYCLFYALYKCRNISMSTITNMFTNDKEWNDMLVRDFIRKWFFVQ